MIGKVKEGATKTPFQGSVVAGSIPWIRPIADPWNLHTPTEPWPGRFSNGDPWTGQALCSSPDPRNNQPPQQWTEPPIDQPPTEGRPHSMIRELSMTPRDEGGVNFRLIFFLFSSPCFLLYLLLWLWLMALYFPFCCEDATSLHYCDCVYQKKVFSLRLFSNILIISYFSCAPQ